ncbi:MAG: transglycosylase SLT domain-containing protein [Myxococcota bacterium]
MDRAVGALAFLLCTVAFASVAGAWSGGPLYYAAAPMCAFEAPASIAAPSSRDLDVEALLEPDSVCPPSPERASNPRLEPEDAREAYRKALRLAERGEAARALLQLQVIELTYPHLADRVALRQAELWLEAGKPQAASEAFARAVASPDSTIRARARVGRVRCRIASGNPDAEAELRSLLRSYPELPLALEMRFELARAKERAGESLTAARMYRSIDLSDPASGVAMRAKARLEALEREGVKLPPLPAEVRVERLERLAWAAPPGMAKGDLSQLHEAGLAPELRSRVALVAARIAHEEGRWDEAHRHLERARWTGSLPEDVSTRVVVSRARDMADASRGRDRERAEKRIRRLVGRKPLERLPIARALKVLELAAPAGLTETADAVLEGLDPRRSRARHRFDAAIVSMGTASDAVVAKVLSGLVDDPRVGLQARYHLARTFERLGRWTEAERELIRVREADGSGLGYYRMWAELRLREVREALVGHCSPDEMHLDLSAASFDPGLEELGASCTAPLPDDEAGEEQTSARMEGLRDPEEWERATSADSSPDTDALADRLAPVAEQWGEAYPWLPRAEALLRLGDRQAASDELHDAYMAWRRAIGRPVRRAGLAAVFRGSDLPRERTTWRTLRDRRALDLESRDRIARVAGALGDTGVAVGFGGWSWADARPRAHRRVVEEAARRHGIDPNLLFAVMRVESVYQRRIISYAGAVGLMQIMPRTGKRIAAQLERHDFNTADLLDPATNVELAAWYLGSLIRRFDGRLPLAIASYNGGPHNVRRWMRSYSPDMPLDAFLERIPFSQTHRYVRRVLTHYAAYRAQEKLPMQQLSTVLPRLGPDPVGF